MEEYIEIPKLLDCTCSDDTQRVYMLNEGVCFDDLSNKEKKLMYESEHYLCEHHFKNAINRMSDLIVISDYLIKFKWLLPKRIRRIIEKYVD